ncbi:hypothetical protein F3Y22_tig00111273pilonHSYRG00421 [Hibiscus syriacus]|uniref:Uncharacterized protein n=1 Tax=Hibiscus syriacus TaxID=106335 RepID=A0A6A2YS33_HIBSY|nr:hypothetical protein F3Y22_tig00111273pilonHSYRG00421 [Hibiscus syriacus]
MEKLRGMSHYVLVVTPHLPLLSLLPCSNIRKERATKDNLPSFMQIFILALLGFHSPDLSHLAWASLFVLQAKALKTYKIISFLNVISVLCGDITSHCRYICDGAQGFSLANWLGHEPSRCCLCWVQFLPCFQPSDDDHSCNHGVFILAEKIFLGGFDFDSEGLYSVLWGKHKEMEDEPIKGMVSGDIEANQVQKNNLPHVALTMEMPESPLNPTLTK